MDDQTPTFDAVFGPGTRKECRRQALVLEALGIAFAVHAHADGFTLVVATADATLARQELLAYSRETLGRPKPVRVMPQRAGGWPGVLGYVTVLLVVALYAAADPLARDWFSAGKTHAGLMRDGQWWRAVTALTLHSDMIHLAANALFGGLIGWFTGQLLGNGLAWLSILIAGATGNALLALIRPAQHTSVGASTAVFAALGILAAYAWMRRKREDAPSLKRLAPLIGGAVLLAFLGTGGERTDVPAHLSGFVSGLLVGTIYGKLGDRIQMGSRVQLLFGLTATAIVAAAWLIALEPSNR